ncbi:two pore domain potassium channel family protein [Shewanella baltica]|nr:two pore domain potassium channel family protein [Shewanella baltica]
MFFVIMTLSVITFYLRKLATGKLTMNKRIYLVKAYRRLSNTLEHHPILTILTLLLLLVISSAIYLSITDIRFKIPDETVQISMTFNDNQELIESKITPEETDKTRTLTFPEAFYFCLVTFSSVGYGDIVPVDEKGRTFCSWLILMSQFFIYALLPIVTASIIDLNREKRRHMMDSSAS